MFCPWSEVTFRCQQRPHTLGPILTSISRQHRPHALHSIVNPEEVTPLPDDCFAR